jgi:hypothetical protein
MINIKKTMVLFIITIIGFSIGIGLWLLNNHQLNQNTEDNEANDSVLNKIYNRTFLGYNSLFYPGGEKIPVGTNGNISIYWDENLSLPMYTYYNVNISSEYINNVTSKFFPGIEIDELNMSLSNPTNPSNAFYILENKTILMYFFRNGGYTYKLKINPSEMGDKIGNETNAEQKALDWLSKHGGVPDDIGRIRANYVQQLNESGVSYIAYYYVEIERKIGDYYIDGFTNRNLISFEIDCGNDMILEFNYHWPDLVAEYELEKIPSVEQILDSYKMNSNITNRTNITKYEVLYCVPLSIQYSRYDSIADVYFVAPFLDIYTEKGLIYRLGIIVPQVPSSLVKKG